LLATLLAPVGVAAEPAPLDVTTLRSGPVPSTTFDMGTLLRAHVKKPTTKLDTALAALAATPELAAQGLAQAAAAQGVRLQGDRVHVQLAVAPERAEAVRLALARLGGEITGAAQDDTLLQGWVPVAQLQAATEIEGVYQIRRPQEPVQLAAPTAGSYSSEGLAAMNVASWHTVGYNGAGVKVGVIDGGFQGYKALLGTDLPASVTVRNFVDGQAEGEVDSNSNTPHGTACAEIVHDIAPGAQLFLAKVGTNIDLQEAVQWMISNQVHIITTSLGWYNLSPGDGTGFFANLVAQARNAGILWITSASNDREAHWGGSWADGDGDGVLNISGTQEVNYFGPGDGNAYFIPAGTNLRLFVRWSDWTAVNQDLDFYLVRWSGSQWDLIPAAGGGYVGSFDYQNGLPGQSPTEFIAYTTSGTATFYGFLVYAESRTRSVDIEIFAPKVTRLDKIVTARSLANLADAPQAMTVAAIHRASPYAQESYSSEGPTNGPGGTINGGFTKPDIAAYANVTTAYYGAGGFNGTSAAAPHVAGAAALVRHAYPGYTPAQIQSLLQSRAIDLGAGGLDYQYGWGRLYLGNPPTAATATATATPTRTATPTLTPTITRTPTVTRTFGPLSRRGYLPMIIRRPRR
jgi:hypothetical protein